ncbi:NAD(P)/FAD-dependent oxidoreductase [Aminobacter ciceronei]|uniref:Glycine/D-amino acid oxidase-like deaminating enzyme n=1 Tax=Aminobacter ciceronei TaxID=150723 RepID=A0ABR6C4E4_9HYPH|nr:FAD-dependent oxidoreductase [Aminobacter ciceronei]MBA8906075.1 glycine/D-amino acid oxidase-like deaminating enzyme [Aminobacter ciceronei]MBA9019854.1 glycine/D-amino acid oxidase-like deaminating enzyme [Aminobacter ciceronei]
MSIAQLTVVGGGLVGAAIAYGAARSGISVRVLDQGDAAFRASRGNFGLVWVSSKGNKMPRYARWSREAVTIWPELHKELLELTGVDTGLHQPGGFWLGFSEQDVEARADLLKRINCEVGGEIPFKMMEPSELKQFLPGLGSAVVGGSFCALDGHANPLMLLRALHAGLKEKGAETISGVDVTEIRRDPDTTQFQIIGRDGQRWKSDRLVLAAGLGNANLAPQVGLEVPITTTRGQILITERLKPFLDFPTNKVRQTREGSVQIGSTSEDVGFNDGTTTDKIEWLARRAVATFPALANARLVRAWGALRPLTADGYPVYQGSTSCPGAFVATCHSGVTLAAIHAFVLAPWMAGLTCAPPDIECFLGDRFRDPNASFSHDH